jgi:hypothetical protein
MVGSAKGSRQSRRGECEGESLAVKGCNLGVGFHQRPGAALDLGEGLEDFRPRPAKNLDVAAGTSRGWG